MLVARVRGQVCNSFDLTITQRSIIKRAAENRYVGIWADLKTHIQILHSRNYDKNMFFKCIFA